MTARARIVQIFENPHPRTINAVYSFPLADDAAVDSLRVRVGERMIIGSVEENMVAEAIYAEAQAAGEKAAPFNPCENIYGMNSQFDTVYLNELIDWYYSASDDGMHDDSEAVEP